MITIKNNGSQGTHLQSSNNLDPWSTTPKTRLLSAGPKTTCAHFTMQLYTEVPDTFHQNKNHEYNVNNKYKVDIIMLPLLQAQHEKTRKNKINKNPNKTNCNNEKILKMLKKVVLMINF